LYPDLNNVSPQEKYGGPDYRAVIAQFPWYGEKPCVPLEKHAFHRNQGVWSCAPAITAHRSADVGSLRAIQPTAQILSQVKTKGRFWVTHPNSPWKTNPRVVGISPRSTFLCILNCAVLHSTLVRSFHIHFHLQAYQLFIVRIVHDVAYYVSSLWEVLWQDRFVALLGQVPMVYCTDRPFMI